MCEILFLKLPTSPYPAVHKNYQQIWWQKTDLAKSNPHHEQVWVIVSMWIKLSIWLKGRRPPEFFSSKVAVPDSHVVSQRHINHEGPVKFRALTQGSTHQPKGPTAREFVRHLGNLSNSNEQVIFFSQDPLSSDEACQRVSADPLSISSIVSLYP